MTLAVRGSYDHEEAARHLGSLSEPAYLATAQHFGSAETMRATAAGEREGWVYARRGNPTVGYLEDTVAALEGYQVDAEVSAAVTTTGMAAITLATMPFLSSAVGARPNIVASPACYGSTVMVFDKRYGEERGVGVRWVEDPLSVADWERRIDEDTRFLYAESPSNPTVQLVDIPPLAALARRARIPLIIDATLATPALMRPLALGADIVVHSLTKAAGASGRSMGGAVIARHDLDLRRQPAELAADFAGYLRRGPMRDMGSVLSPFNAWTLLADIRELRSRVDAMSASALRVAEHLAGRGDVVEVFYPGLPSHRTHHLARRDMWLVDSDGPGREAVNRFGFLLGFRPAGGVPAAHGVLDRLRLFWRANNLGQVKSTATIPAIGTHQQIAGDDPVPPDMIRLSVGLEHADDLIEDLDQALTGSGVPGPAEPAADRAE
ncbi:PLP-dependent aspartate aminotransferase family protein [Amycolatopsis sp. MtRt-6]|uniref:trans-sulfuration enzyme family protein n=1 Tax=Amycolatopsis sp. MtRt-6 TaxID=2792782 RepID=UPI001A8EAF3D|nr:PLP-dependent aspartate aminotransferase family protein [Amycolatopsis sp. MtRt-6]